MVLLLKEDFVDMCFSAGCCRFSGTASGMQNASVVCVFITVCG